VADRVVSTDPLEASSRAEQIAARQVNEPLTARVTAPFDPERQVAGLARKARSSDNDTVWTFKLRTGVRFQDGSPFNAQAVLSNATRWRTTAAGRVALPGLLAADAPRPDEVRFVLSAPDPRFPRRLASPRLGIVSPDALEPRSGEGAVVDRSLATGTGAFEIRQRDAALTLLARHTNWWGAFAGVDLGPALDQIELRTEASPSLRLALLDAGDTQLADELRPDQAAQAEEDPLLTVLPGPQGIFLGLERSVRGVTSAREISPLSQAWLTQLEVAD
jgi:peptide/nickel transport system substrate-binding protein